MTERQTSRTAPTERRATGAGRSSASKSATTAKPGSKSPPTAAPAHHRREMIALALLGVAVFLAFVLIAGRRGGALGDAATSALSVLVGRLAFLLPLALLVVSALLIFDVRLRLAYPWVVGTVIGLVGLMLLTAAAFPPVGPSHGVENFVPEVYRARAGWIGEVLYAGGTRLGGSVGVGISGWLLLLAGVSLVTGLSLRRTLVGTGRAALKAKEGAERTSRYLRERDLADAADSPGPLDDPYLHGFPVAAPVVAGTPDVGIHEAGDDGYPVFDPESPTVVGNETLTATPKLLDAAAAYPDLFGDEMTVRAAPSVAAGPLLAATDEPTLAARPARAEGPTDAASAARASVTRQDSLPGLDAPPAKAAAYTLPGSHLLRKSSTPVPSEGRGDRETAALLVETLSHFGVDANVVGMVVGPRVTRYELQLAPGTKVSKVAGLKDDLAYALASTEIRILAPIPGKQAVGVEVPNQRPSFVTLGDIYRDFPRTAGPLMVWLGKDISGKPIYTDLAKLPHLLIAGTTGSGKSGCVNCIISSILLRAEPEQVKLILIDPKKVELSHYDYIPHLMVPVVTNMKNAAGVLHNIVKEMENRYELMELEKCRHLDEMNKVRARRGERMLPYVVIVIDELADLMMVSPGEVEEYVIRLAQKARAVGIHLVVATQRPSVDVITGMIKANIPSRIAFAVSSQTDSRVILDVNGAETLLGMGDMLFKPLGSSRLQRIQGALITEEEIHLLVTHVRGQASPEYQEELLEPPKREPAHEDEAFDPDSDDLLADAALMVLETGSASVSMLQRRLRVGYTRAGRLIDMLERRGIVGPYEGSKSRQILVRPEERARVLEELQIDAGVPVDTWGVVDDDDAGIDD